ncbi:MAG: 3-oxoacyl-[acyl-carrier-protein] reductase [Rhodocyclales bacterium]|nr:3-oxoacyl-[acyl-carrier-protein] reductase [Rhodocyclales bacterium]
MLNWFRKTRTSALLDPRDTDLAPRVLVLGASGAIGYAIAETFARQGASLALHANRNTKVQGKLIERCAELGAIGLCGVQGDLADPERTRQIVNEAATTLGGLDVLVIAVGHADDQPLLMTEPGAMEAALQSNLAPVVNACEAFRALRAGWMGGAVVVVSSITGRVGQPMRMAYGASKAAVEGYVRSFAREVAASGLTANCVAPQVIEGGLADLMKARVRSLLLANTPLARACEADDVAGAALYLASEGARYVTGTSLNVTGGLVTW